MNRLSRAITTCGALFGDRAPSFGPFYRMSNYYAPKNFI